MLVLSYLFLYKLLEIGYYIIDLFIWGNSHFHPTK